MNANEVLAWLRTNSSTEAKANMRRYGIPDRNALGVPMGVMKTYAKSIGTDHVLAGELWKAGIYEAQTVAVFIANPDELRSREMDTWASDFDNWAICDTACFHLFDKLACPPRSGPWTMIVGSFQRETWDAEEEAYAGADHRQAA